VTLGPVRRDSVNGGVGGETQMSSKYERCDLSPTMKGREKGAQDEVQVWGKQC
jgi:hypothetical protein